MKTWAWKPAVRGLLATGVVMAGLALAACGGDDDEPAATAVSQVLTSASTTTLESTTASISVTTAETSSVTTTSTSTATAPTTTVATRSADATTSSTTSVSTVAGELKTSTESIYFNLDSSPGYELLVAAAAINNEADATLEGAEARIDLLDAAGATVGSSTFTLPRIGPVQSYVLVIQATSIGADKIHSMAFNAKPASLVATIVTPGRLIDAPGDGLTYEDLKVYASTTTPGAYELEATLVTTGPVVVRDIGYKTALVLDASNNVVGLGLGRADTAGLSTVDPLPAGTRIPVSATVSTPTAEVALGLFNVFVEP